MTEEGVDGVAFLCNAAIWMLVPLPGIKARRGDSDSHAVWFKTFRG